MIGAIRRRLMGGGSEERCTLLWSRDIIEDDCLLIEPLDVTINGDVANMTTKPCVKDYSTQDMMNVILKSYPATGQSIYAPTLPRRHVGMNVTKISNTECETKDTYAIYRNVDVNSFVFRKEITIPLDEQNGVNLVGYDDGTIFEIEYNGLYKTPPYFMTGGYRSVSFFKASDYNYALGAISNMIIRFTISRADGTFSVLDGSITLSRYDNGYIKTEVKPATQQTLQGVVNWRSAILIYSYCAPGSIKLYKVD